MRVGQRTGEENKGFEYQNKLVRYALCQCQLCKRVIKIPISECYSKVDAEAIFTKANVQLGASHITHKCTDQLKGLNNIIGVCKPIGFCEEVVKKEEKMKDADCVGCSVDIEKS